MWGEKGGGNPREGGNPRPDQVFISPDKSSTRRGALS